MACKKEKRKVFLKFRYERDFWREREVMDYEMMEQDQIRIQGRKNDRVPRLHINRLVRVSVCHRFHTELVDAFESLPLKSV